MFKISMMAVMLGLGTACNAQSPSAQHCWPEMQENFVRIYNQATLQGLGMDKVLAERGRLRQLLKVCLGVVDYEYAAVPAEASYNYVTLLDIAVAADDEDLLRKVLSETDPKRLKQAVDIRTESNDYNPLFLSAILESFRAFTDLINYKFDPPVDPKMMNSNGYQLIHVAGGQTAGGLKLIRMLVDMGFDPNSKTTAGQTPLLTARARGDVHAVHCLMLLGAMPPESLPALQDDSMNETIRQNRVEIDKILRTGVVEPDETVMRICGHNEM